MWSYSGFLFYFFLFKLFPVLDIRTNTVLLSKSMWIYAESRESIIKLPVKFVWIQIQLHDIADVFILIKFQWSKSKSLLYTRWRLSLDLATVYIYFIFFFFTGHQFICGGDLPNARQFNEHRNTGTRFQVVKCLILNATACKYRYNYRHMYTNSLEALGALLFCLCFDWRILFVCGACPAF